MASVLHRHSLYTYARHVICLSGQVRDSPIVWPALRFYHTVGRVGQEYFTNLGAGAWAFIKRPLPGRLPTTSSQIHLLRAARRRHPMSIEMADNADFDHSGLQEVANAVRESSGADDLLGGTNQKRKRELSDHDGSADAQRRASNKRVSPNQKNENDVNDQANAFMDAHHEGDAGVTAIQEYSNLHDQSMDPQNGAQDHTNASSTAAAALGIYPTMNIPQTTNLQFQTQGPDDNANQDTSFMDNSQQQNESYMDNSTATPSGRNSMNANKPAVGSEEWHKVRKDNHKEGKEPLRFHHITKADTS